MKKTGLSLIELIVVIVIIGITVALSAPFFARFTAGTKLKTLARSVTSVLRTTRGYAIANNKDYYVFFDTTDSLFYISDTEDGSDIEEKKYGLQDGVYFYDPNTDTDGIGFTKGTTADAACFKPTGELDESADTTLYVSDGNSLQTASDYIVITVDKATGRAKID